MNESVSVSIPVARPPLRRMHHIAYVVKDQGKTREFYEDLVGLPLLATWAESVSFPEVPGEPVEFCHTFFGLDDGSTLAFFGFADTQMYELFRTKSIGWAHPAIYVSADEQLKMKERFDLAGWPTSFTDHGYCQSLYVKDPDDLTLEFTSEPENATDIADWQKESARATLDNWLKGDRRPNNDIRHLQR